MTFLTYARSPIKTLSTHTYRLPVLAAFLIAGGRGVILARGLRGFSPSTVEKP